MENQIDNSFRSFIARRSSANTGSDQIANGSFLKKYYHSSWNHIGLSPDISQKISEHLQLSLSRMEQNQQHGMLMENSAESHPEK